MKVKALFAGTQKGRASFLVGVIVLQAICAVFFVADVGKDLLQSGRVDSAYLAVEVLAAVALIGGVVFLVIELRSLLGRMSNMQVGLEIAKGQLAEVIARFFDRWALTSAERDVGLMILKGFDNDAIAKIRKTASGTVRAQATSIYTKSGTDGRAQFISHFMEELLAGEIGR